MLRNLGGDMAADMTMREVRRTPTAAPPPPPIAAGHGAAHTSLGRLLRLIADPRSDDTHMDAAIAHLQVGAKSSAGGAKMPPPRALALADHRHISNLESVLDAVDLAIAVLKTSASTDGTSGSESASARNMLQALARALAMQSVDDCASTKANVCLWTTQSNKRLALLEWMLHRSPPATSGVIVDVLVAELQANKTSQLRTSLVVFELAQRQCRRVGRSGQRAIFNWCALIDPLVAVVRRGTMQTASGPKASKLGVAALDALIGVLCITVISAGNRQQVLNGATAALATLQLWNARSVRRQWVRLAAGQLASVLRSYEASDNREVMEMVMWHWKATAMWLCSRSDCVLAAKKQLHQAITHTIDAAHALVDAHTGASMTQHSLSVLLNRLCALLSIYNGSAADLKKAVFSVHKTGKLLITLTACLSAPATQALAVSMLRLCVIGDSTADGAKSDPLFSLSKAEVEAFISMVGRFAEATGSFNDNAGLLVSELCLRTGVRIEIHGQEGGRGDARSTFGLSIIDKSLDCCSTVYADDPALTRQWLLHTSDVVLNVLWHHPAIRTRNFAVRLLPKLDQVACMKFFASRLQSDADATTASTSITLLFFYAREREALLQELASALVDAVCRGAVMTQAISNPSDFGRALVPESTEKGEQREATAMSVSRHDWCVHASPRTRVALVSIIIRKVFGSPRDSVLITWLRELSLLGWFDAVLEEVVPIITTHIKNVDKLSDSLLQDDSPHSARAVEHLLFARLTPSLVLRVIPRSSFLSLHRTAPSMLLNESAPESDLSELARLLWSQVLDPLEFKEVKMLSVELLTKLPAEEILPHALHQLVAFLHGRGTPLAVVKVLSDDGVPLDGGGFVAAKLLVYYLNLVFTDETTVVEDQALLERALCVLLTVLSLPCAPNESFSAAKSPLVDLQMGTIECLALLLTKSLHRSRKCHPATGLEAIEDALVDLVLASTSPSTPPRRSPPASNQRSFEKWRQAARDVGSESDAFSATQVQICCCNVLLSALGKLDASALRSFQERVLCSHILPRLGIQFPAPVLAGCLQIAFSFLFRAGASLESDDPSALKITSQGLSLVLEVMHATQTVDDVVYLNALKLFGALIGKVAWFWPSLSSDPTGEQSIASGLQRLRDSQQIVSPAVRQLAQSLLEAIVPA